MSPLAFPLLLLLLLPPLISSQSSHDESLRVILCSSLICDPPKICDIYEGIPQCRAPPTTTPAPTTTTLPTLPTLWTVATFPTFPSFTFSSPPPLPSISPPTSSSPSTRPSVCSLPPDTGPCNRNRIMWYFDTESDSCQRFSYSGCGNGNRFSSRYQCELRCLSDAKEEMADIK